MIIKITNKKMPHIKNKKTGELEWQKPTEYKEFENKGEMFGIELEDRSRFLVSEKHKVYVRIEYYNSNNSTNSAVLIP